MPQSSIHTAQLHHWLEKMRAGDLAARDELLRGFCQRLEWLARKMLKRFPQVRRWAQTDDVLQNALMRLLRSLQKVEPASIGEFFGLAALEMRRELLDLARHFHGPQGIGANHASHASPGSNGSAGAERSPEPVAVDGNDDLDQWQAFHESVERLPDDERDVVNLVYYHGWTQVEAATMLKVSERTVRRRWESAMVQLHQRLNPRSRADE